MGKPKPIGSILEVTLKGLDVDFQLKAYSIWGAWRKIVGEPVADQTQPRSIRNRILFVDVSHPTWIQQLQFLKPNLLEKLNAFLGEPLLQDIRFRLGKITRHVSPAPDPQVCREHELDEETLQRIDGLLKQVGDRELKKSLRDLLIKGAKSDRSRATSR